ncbi:YeeE/YedE family protein, partial [Rhizobium leguminosarum]
MSTYLPSLAGGILIGTSAAMLLLLNGRIAGISGIVGRLAQGVGLT